MFSLINSPWVGMLICIFTYLHSLWVPGCRSRSASGEIALGYTSGYIAFCSISLGLRRLFFLKDSSLAPHHCSLPANQPDIFSSVEEMRWIRECFCLNVLTHSVTMRISEGGLLHCNVLCDLENRGSYFHHATTSPHWPCNGAMPLLDWLPRLKTPLSCCCSVWKSSLAHHASMHRRMCLHTYHCH